RGLRLAAANLVARTAECGQSGGLVRLPAGRHGAVRPARSRTGGPARDPATGAHGPRAVAPDRRERAQAPGGAPFDIGGCGVVAAPGRQGLRTAWPVADGETARARGGGTRPLGVPGAAGGLVPEGGGRAPAADGRVRRPSRRVN